MERMRKWLILLAAVLLFSACAHAEEAEFYTNKLDLYYHADPDCDRPPEEDEFGQKWDYYDRDCYQKYPISEEAAAEFGKAACPVCVKGYAPVYLGEHTPEGDVAEPWAIKAGGTPDSDAYCQECEATLERFAAYFEEVYDRETGSYVRRPPYPDAYAGMWYNCTGGYTYAIVDPTPEVLDSFQRNFGGGAWIVPAKYSYNALCAVQDQIFDLVNDWRARHPGFDLEVDSAAVNTDYLEVILYGASYEEAMPVLDAELELPVWVRFAHTSQRAEWF